MERIDYLDVAQQFVKKYKLKSKVVFVNTKDQGDYVVETDEIQLRRSYPSVKEFLMTVLHEIHHALMAQRHGKRKFLKMYNQAGTMAAYRGLNPHDDNKWEEKAESFARNELKKYQSFLKKQTTYIYTNICYFERNGYVLNNITTL